jgi:hypothetical protein
LDAWAGLGYDADMTKRVLLILSRAFRWSETDVLRLRPDDRVWTLYRSYYPPLTGWRRWVGFDSFRPDELEMESLSRDLQTMVTGGKSVDLHETVTVGDLVRLTA